MREVRLEDMNLCRLMGGGGGGGNDSPKARSSWHILLPSTKEELNLDSFWPHDTDYRESQAFCPFVGIASPYPLTHK
jgi:hypothetical protein